jgi:hypothetical protein
VSVTSFFFFGGIFTLTGVPPKFIRQAGGCSAVTYVARMHEDNLIYINNFLRSIRPEWYHVVSYNDIMDHRDETMLQLAKFLVLPFEKLQESAQKILHANPSALLLQPEDLNFLRNRIFTNERRQMLWPLLSTNKRSNNPL